MLPSQTEIEIPLLEALVELGGEAEPKEIYALVIEKFPNISKPALAEVLPSGRNKWTHRIRWVRQRLVSNSEIDSPRRGIWRITDKGRRRVANRGGTALVTTPTTDDKYLKGDLVTDGELEKVARSRKSPNIVISVPQADVQSLLIQGYRIEKKLKRNTRLVKAKLHEEQFEDEIWLLFSKLGFSTLNRTNDFFIDVSKPSESPRWEQIDVFAKDDDGHVFVVECRYTKDPAAKRMKSVIQKLAQHKSRIIDAVRKFYDDRTLKVSFVIATRNIKWSSRNLEAARNKDIFVWQDNDIDHVYELARLYSLIGDAVRYQLYATMFPGQRIQALTGQKVAAIEGKAGEYTYYQFVATPEQLLRIAYVHRRQAHGFADFKGISNSYQRILKQAKVKAIRQFIDDRRYFPNSIIISFEEPPQFDLMPGQQELNFNAGTLTLPCQYGSAWIIDGQHRLYGYANSERGKTDPIPVIAFKSLSLSEQSRLFVEINKNQTNVETNLLWDLYGDIYQGSEDKKQREDLTVSNIVKHLDTMRNSPFQGHIYIPSHGKKSTRRNLTMTTLCQNIKLNGLLSIDMLGRVTLEQQDFELFAAERIAAFFRSVKSLYLEDWRQGDKGDLRTNNGVAALFVVLKWILKNMNMREEYLYTKSNTSDFETEVYLRLAPAIEHLRASAGHSGLLRRRAGQAGQTESAFELLGKIKEEYSDFYVPLLGNISETSSTNQTGVQAQNLDELIKDTELQLRVFIMQTLKDMYGDAWYRKGVPGGAKKYIDAMLEHEIRNHPYNEAELRSNIDNRLEFTNLGHLKDIIIYGENWPNFERVFKSRNNFESHFTDYNNLRNAYRGHMRVVDPVLDTRGRGAIKWIRRCLSLRSKDGSQLL